MNQVYSFNYVKACIRLTISAAVVAIVVISPHLASAETPTALSMPQAMADKIRAPEAGKETFDTPFFNAKEEPLTLNDFKGRGLVVNFWATWCAPCIREMPSLNRLAKSLEGTGVEFLAISEDRKGPKIVPDFLKTKGFESLKPYYDPKGLLARKFGIVGLPSTVLINAEGLYMGRVMGTLEWDSPDIKAFLVQDLAPKPTPDN